jgi:hypothetical protein
MTGQFIVQWPRSVIFQSLFSRYTNGEATGIYIDEMSYMSRSYLTENHLFTRAIENADLMMLKPPISIGSKDSSQVCFPS